MTDKEQDITDMLAVSGVDASKIEEWRITSAPHADIVCLENQDGEPLLFNISLVDATVVGAMLAEIRRLRALTEKG